LDPLEEPEAGGAGALVSDREVGSGAGGFVGDLPLDPGPAGSSTAL